MQLLQGRPHKIAWENNKTNLNNNGPYPKNKGAACYWSSSKIRGSRELSTILGWGGGGGYFLGLDSLLRKNTFFSVKCIVGKFKFAVLHQFFVCVNSQFPQSRLKSSTTWLISWKMILYSRPKLSDLFTLSLYKLLEKAFICTVCNGTYLCSP